MTTNHADWGALAIGDPAPRRRRVRPLEAAIYDARARRLRSSGHAAALRPFRTFRARAAFCLDLAGDIRRHVIGVDYCRAAVLEAHSWWTRQARAARENAARREVLP